MTSPEPGGCRWCGIPKRTHCQRWSSLSGWHGYVHPTQEQIRDRMVARREARRG